MPNNQEINLTHEQLIDFMNKFHGKTEPGYKMDRDGICFGLSAMAAQAILAGKFQDFCDRLIKISELVNNNEMLQSQIDQLDSIPSSPENEGEKWQEIIDYKAFFDGIALYFEPEAHKHLLLESPLGFITQIKGRALVHNLIKPSKTTKDNLQSTTVSAGIYSLNDIIKYLNALITTIQTQGNNDNIAFSLTDYYHNIVLGYNHETKTFNIIDANQLSEVNVNYQATNKEDITKLASKLFESFGKIPNTDNTLVGFSTIILALTNLDEPKNHDLFIRNLNPQEFKLPTTAEEYLINLAVMHNATTTIDNLLKQSNINFNKNDEFGMTPLTTAISNHSLDAVKLLLQSNACDVDQPDKDGNIPVILAIQEKQFDIAKLLISNNCNINKYNNKGESLIIMAIQHGYIDIINSILSQEINLNTYQNMLGYAIKYQQHEILNLIIQNEQFKNINIGSMVFSCINCNNIEALKIFLDKGADLTAPCFLGQTPIFWAALYKKPDAIKLILDNGVDPSTQIVSAVKYRCSFLAKRLLEQGADPYKALFLAIKQKNSRAVKMLLTHGAAPNQTIFQAITNKDQDAIKFLLECGIRPYNAISVAIKEKDKEAINTILNYTFTDKKLKASLIQNAIKLGNTEIIKQFLDYSKAKNETVKYQELMLLTEESSKTLTDAKKTEIINLLKTCDPENFSPAFIIRKKLPKNNTDSHSNNTTLKKP
jgi:ankyrin repeat protein